MAEKIRVVVADDSPFICRLLTGYLESDPDIKVIQTVQNGKEAMRAAKKMIPDVMTLDLNMPGAGGLEVLKYVMAECPTAVVLISGVTRESARMTSMGVSLGAVDFILKYSPGAMPAPDALRREIIAKVKAAARVKVIRSIPSLDVRFSGRLLKSKVDKPPARRSGSATKQLINRLAIIGASTGGPLALKELLSSMNPIFAFPVVIVQHMPEGFTSILAQQFNTIFPFSVRQAAHGDSPENGSVLIAPGDKHLLFDQDGTVLITNTKEINGHRPSIDVTMQSAAQAFGDRVIGVVLSGMGDDGTQGLAAIQSKTGFTYAQSKETCVVDSMPGSAIRNRCVNRIGSPSEIGKWLTGIQSLRNERGLDRAAPA